MSYALQIFEQARQDVIAETIKEVRALIHEAMKASKEEGTVILSQLAVEAERYNRLQDFNALANVASRINEIREYQETREKMKRATEVEVWRKRLRFAVQKKFDEVETEEEIDRINDILSEIAKINANSPTFNRDVQSILNRLEKL